MPRADLVRERARLASTFPHFLDLPILLVIVALGVLRPETWALAAVGALVAVAGAGLLTTVVPRLCRDTLPRPDRAAAPLAQRETKAP